ncbi:MAG: hypothetical protein QMD07_00020 [Thermodesulfovibrionales bacterium]|nr:hypothetical protein [Thermodesulfovibrionales bacterium]
MLVASGYIEAHDEGHVEVVVNDLKKRKIEVTDLKEEKVVFLIERDTPAEMKKELDTLKDVEGARGVYLSYYSLEGADVNASEEGAGAS